MSQTVKITLGDGEPTVTLDGRSAGAAKGFSATRRIMPRDEYLALCRTLPRHPETTDPIERELEFVHQLSQGIEHVMSRYFPSDQQLERLEGRPLMLAFTAPVALAAQIDQLRDEARRDRSADPRVRQAMDGYLWQLSQRLRDYSDHVEPIVTLRQRQHSIFARITARARRIFGIRSARDVNLDEWHDPEDR